LAAAPREEEAVGDPEPEEPEPDAFGEVELAEEPEAVAVAFPLPDLAVPGFLTSNCGEEVKI